MGLANQRCNSSFFCFFLKFLEEGKPTIPGQDFVKIDFASLIEESIGVCYAFCIVSVGFNSTTMVQLRFRLVVEIACDDELKLALIDPFTRQHSSPSRPAHSIPAR